MTSKSKVLVTSSILNISYFLLSMVAAFLLMPLVVRSLGDRMYGLWMVAGSLMGYYWLIDFGISSAMARFISRAVGQKDDQEVNITINSGLFLYTIGGGIALTLSLILAVVAPALMPKITDVSVFRIIFVILGINFAINFPARVFSGIIRAYLRYDIITSISFLILFLRTGLTYVLMKNGAGIVALALITLVCDVVNRTLMYVFCRKVCHPLIFSRKFVLKRKIKELMHYGGFAFISQISAQMVFNIDNIVIAMFLGLSPVTLYSVASRLVGYFRHLISTALGMMMPVFSQYEGQGDFHSIREKFVFVYKINGYATVLAGGLMLIFGSPFIERWMGPEYASAYQILLVLGVAQIFGKMQTPFFELLEGISKNRFSAIVDLTEGVSNFILSVILVRKMGILGVAIGTAVPMVISSMFVIPWYACRAIKLSVGRYYRESLWGVLVRAVLPLGLCYPFYRHLIEPDYGKIFSLGFLQVLIYVLFVYNFGFTRHEKNIFLKVFAHIPFFKRFGKKKGAVSGGATCPK